MIRAIMALGIALLPSCATSISLEELDRLERSLAAQTVVFNDDYALWSPYTLEDTQEWVQQTEEELAASRLLFGATTAGRLQILLSPIAGLGERFAEESAKIRVTPPHPHPLHGVAGQAYGRQIIVYVTPDRTFTVDGQSRRVHRSAGDFRSTLRHELAHVHANAVGLTGGTWFTEGVADLVQSLVLEDGKLVDRGPDKATLDFAGTLPREQWGVVRLLDWREYSDRIRSGDEAVDQASRTLCGLFVRFLIECQSQSSLVDNLRAVQRVERAELSGLDTQWRSWLAEAITKLPE